MELVAADDMEDSWDEVTSPTISQLLTNNISIHLSSLRFLNIFWGTWKSLATMGPSRPILSGYCQILSTHRS